MADNQYLFIFVLRLQLIHEFKQPQPDVIEAFPARLFVVKMPGLVIEGASGEGLALAAGAMDELPETLVWFNFMMEDLAGDLGCFKSP